MIRMLVTISIISAVWAGYLAAGDGTAASPPTTQPQAKQVLDKLLQQAPPLTPPKSTGSLKPQRKAPLRFEPTLPAGRTEAGTGHKLLPEGYALADRRGRLLHRGEDWVFLFESDGKAMTDPPITLLPNSWLEKMETDVAASADPIVFQVSGEITTYRGKNYLLLRRVLVERRYVSGSGKS